MLALGVRFITSLLVLLLATPSLAGTISRPAKSFGGNVWINGVVPQASDLNGDIDTIYSEFNGNISDANISTSASIAPTKINPDGFTVNIRTVNTQPCTTLEESDQPADSKRWALCSVGGEFRVSTYSDAGSPQANWLAINRANGGFQLGGASGTNTVNGATTFNHAVTFLGSSSLVPTGTVMMFMGTTAPVGWLLMDGATNSCTGTSSANANLCAQLVGLFPTANYKGAAAGTVTVDTASDEVISLGHGNSVGDRVHFSTTGTLPAPLGASTVYCIVSVTTDRYKIGTACGGAAVDITSTGSGTHSHHFNFVTPDARGRNVIGSGTGAGLTARTIGATGGEEQHQLLASESGLPAHSHTINDPGHSHSLQSGEELAIGGIPALLKQFSTSSTAFTSTNSTGITINSTGPLNAPTPHNVMDPFIVMTYIIKL
jgi:microcystin-dependent protein